VIGPEVEIGANTTVDRATFGATEVGAGTKIDNQVQIGHNCRIGTHNLLIAHVGLGGSCVTGDRVTMAGKVGVADHATVGDGATIGAYAGVHGDVPAKSVYLGIPARPVREARRILTAVERVPEMWRGWQEVRKRLGLSATDAAVEDEPQRRAG
jgi:UDP-3-O-[3-hydroxymyristoyl] glucosamine N-acyltransferase